MLPLLSKSVAKRLFLYFAPFGMLLALIVVLLYGHSLAQERELAVQRGAYIVEVQKEIIDRDMKAASSALLHLSQQSGLVQFLTHATGRSELEQEYQQFIQSSELYDQVRLLDTSGDEKIRVERREVNPISVPELDLQSKVERYYFQSAIQLEAGEVYVSPLDLNVERGQVEQPWRPVIRLASPVFDASGRKSGILILNYLGEALLRQLSEIAAQGKGYHMLVNEDGYYISCPEPERAWGFMWGAEPAFIEDHPEAWLHIGTADSGEVFVESGIYAFQSTMGPSRADELQLGPELKIKIVSFIPTSILQERSDQALRILLWMSLGMSLIFLVLCWHLAQAEETRRMDLQSLAGSESRLRRLSSQLLHAHEEERRHISRDLHDQLGQVVTALNIQLQRALKTERVSEKNELIEYVISGTADVLGSVRDIASRIRPSILDDLGLGDALQSYISEYESTTSIFVQCDLQFEDEQLPAIVTDNIYRVIQEALTNVSLHAETDSAVIMLHQDGDQLRLSIRDRGIGFEPMRETQQLGLLGIRERVELLNGTFSLTTGPGQGTSIEIIIPLSSHDRPEEGVFFIG